MRPIHQGVEWVEKWEGIFLPHQPSGIWSETVLMHFALEIPRL